jgi:hypothetical protein
LLGLLVRLLLWLMKEALSGESRALLTARKSPVILTLTTTKKSVVNSSSVFHVLWTRRWLDRSESAAVKSWWDRILVPFFFFVLVSPILCPFFFVFDPFFFFVFVDPILTSRRRKTTRVRHAVIVATTAASSVNVTGGDVNSVLSMR